MTMARFRSKGKVYELASIDEITPRMLLTFPRDASEVMGRPIRFADVERIAEEIDALDEEEAERHPDVELLTVVLIWISRCAAGDKVTFGDCLDDPFSFVADEAVTGPKDRLPSKKRSTSTRRSGAAKVAAGGRGK